MMTYEGKTKCEYFIFCLVFINTTPLIHLELPGQSQLLPLRITETSFSHSLRSLATQKNMIDLCFPTSSLLNSIFSPFM